MAQSQPAGEPKRKNYLKPIGGDTRLTIQCPGKDRKYNKDSELKLDIDIPPMKGNDTTIL